jgi:hypothetical protein
MLTIYLLRERNVGNAGVCLQGESESRDCVPLLLLLLGTLNVKCKRKLGDFGGRKKVERTSRFHWTKSLPRDNNAEAPSRPAHWPSEASCVP